MSVVFVRESILFSTRHTTRLCTGNLCGVAAKNWTRSEEKLCRLQTMTNSIGGAAGLSTRSENMPLIIGHNKRNREFYIKLLKETPTEQQERAILQYSWVRPGLVDLYHTSVPEEFQHRGIARRLAEAAFDHFTSNDVHMRLTCSYLQKFVKDNPLPRYISKVDMTGVDTE